MYANRSKDVKWPELSIELTFRTRVSGVQPIAAQNAKWERFEFVTVFKG